MKYSNVAADFYELGLGDPRAISPRTATASPK
jgi:hypothetical protein